MILQFVEITYLRKLGIYFLLKKVLHYINVRVILLNVAYDTKYFLLKNKREKSIDENVIR